MKIYLDDLVPAPRDQNSSPGDVSTPAETHSPDQDQPLASEECPSAAPLDSLIFPPDPDNDIC